MKQFSIPSNTLFYPIDTEELNWIIKKIHMEFTAGLTDGSLMISYYLMQLLILLNRSMDGETGHQQRAEIYPELLALRDQMLGNCSHLWTIAELCDILGVGKSQLYKYYTSYFHATPKEELIKARLQKAKYLLLTTSYTVKEIAYSSGFENINHFNRIFKSTVGCSPGTFRHGA